MNRYNVVLFDLDGTLLDTSEGIFNSVRFAEKMMGFNPLPTEKLKNFIGPPPIKSYMENHNASKMQAETATKYHRQYGAEYGIFEANVYEGISELLNKLKSNGVKLGVCTLKRQDIAEKVLQNFELYNYFDVIVGIDQQESLTKKGTIDIALKKLDFCNRKDVVLVGDSRYDADGAEQAGVDFLGVLYGFGLDEDDSYKFKTVNNVEMVEDFLFCGGNG